MTWPTRTFSPANSLTPRRWPGLSLVFLAVPPAFTCDMLLPCYYDGLAGDDLAWSVIDQLVGPNVLKTHLIIAQIANLVNQRQTFKFVAPNLPGGDGQAEAGAGGDLGVDILEEAFENQV